MAKFNFEVAFGFLPQSAEGVYNATLDAIAASWTAAQGLLLGDPESGVGKSGLSLTLGRSRRDKGFHAGSFTRELSDFLAAEVPTFEVVLPFCGNRANAAGTPVDGDAVPLAGLDGLLQGTGLIGAAWGSGVGHRYVFGATNPISALVYLSGHRLELQDCRVSLKIDYAAGEIPLLTATVQVGSVKEHSAAALPGTLTYGAQATISAPAVKSVGHQWQDTRGFRELSLEVTPAYEEFGDSNTATGIVQEASDRETKINGVLWSDDAAGKVFDWSQLVATSSGVLDPLSFTVGAAMVGGQPAVAHRIIAAQPELQNFKPEALGTKAGSEVEMLLRGASANAELEIIFL